MVKRGVCVDFSRNLVILFLSPYERITGLAYGRASRNIGVKREGGDLSILNVMGKYSMGFLGH